MSSKNKQETRHYGDNAQSEQSSDSVNRGLKKKQELDDREKSLSLKEAELIEKEADINERLALLAEQELQAKNNFPELFKKKFAEFKRQLEEREARCAEEWGKIEKEKEELLKREFAIKKAEAKRDAGYADEKKRSDDELEQKRREFEEDIRNKREERFSELQDEIDKERKKRLELLTAEMDKKRSEFDREMDKIRKALKEKETALIKREQEVEDLELKKKKAQRSREHYDEECEKLKDEIEKGIRDERQSLRMEMQNKDNEIERLRESIRTSNALIANFEELRRKLGDEDPAAVLLKLKTYEEEIKVLREDLARPTLEMQEAFDRIKSKKENLESILERLSEENHRLSEDMREQNKLMCEIDDLKSKIKMITDQKDNIEAHNNQLQADIKRLQSAYEREEDREARIRDIEAPYIQKELPRAELPNQNIKDEENAKYELKWLDNISKSCIDYGLRFPRRILHAFHTALKTSEWSPITVLAGVSGTGKSELPRLYSHFGGINFLSLSVQPNWDSQESMLGFFNSIDNKFDAQPVLRLLAQSQKAKSEDYPFGLENSMNLILMDEMNLAYVELYFAEFLSKLELRRGSKGNEVPCLEVKLGAGIPHYDLPLGRNVLWAGTMNQDETTKSLSDKVLDRGIVINFPRPTTLERRRKLKPLGEQSPLLSRKLWESWWSKESKFNDDQILPFKGFIEDMNTSLSKVGRALGHRVWQSIEYYMANYPDVLEAQRNNDDAGLVKAMKVAFEDQLVQKVMPKLRGIETRGKSKSDCLDKIRTQLKNDDYTIIDDFDLACEFGYGQFIWNSANYLKDDEAVNGQENAENR